MRRRGHWIVGPASTTPSSRPRTSTCSARWPCRRLPPWLDSPPLPYRLHWIDSRGDPGAKAEAPCLPITILPKPALAAESAMPNGLYLVMTHSHALDLDICERILRRGDFAFLGLIGSATKGRNSCSGCATAAFKSAQIARLVCPIGVSGIRQQAAGRHCRRAMAQVLTSSERVLPGLENRLKGGRVGRSTAP